MAMISVTTNRPLVHVEFISDSGERRIIEPNEAGAFEVPAREYRIYTIREEKPEMIYQFGPGDRASFLLRSRPCENCAAVYLSPLSGGETPVAVLPGCARSFPRRCYEGVRRG